MLLGCSLSAGKCSVVRAYMPGQVAFVHVSTARLLQTQRPQTENSHKVTHVLPPCLQGQWERCSLTEDQLCTAHRFSQVLEEEFGEEPHIHTKQDLIWVLPHPPTVLSFLSLESTLFLYQLPDCIKSRYSGTADWTGAECCSASTIFTWNAEVHYIDYLIWQRKLLEYVQKCTIPPYQCIPWNQILLIAWEQTVLILGWLALLNRTHIHTWLQASGFNARVTDVQVTQVTWETQELDTSPMCDSCWTGHWCSNQFYFPWNNATNVNTHFLERFPLKALFVNHEGLVY